MKDQMKLLIGYDGSECANAAIDDLRRAGFPREAQAIIFSVFKQWLPHAAVNNLVHPAPFGICNGNVCYNAAQPLTETHALALDAKRRV